MTQYNHHSKYPSDTGNFFAEQFDMDDGSEDQDYRYYDDEPMK